jgi:hypothetical protein
MSLRIFITSMPVTKCAAICSGKYRESGNKKGTLTELKKELLSIPMYIGDQAVTTYRYIR